MSLSAPSPRPDSLMRHLRNLLVILMVLLMIPAVASLSAMGYYAHRYHTIIAQVEKASALKPIVRDEIPGEVWNVVSGQKKFKEASHYQLVGQVNAQLSRLLESARHPSRREIIAATCAMNTMVRYIDQTGQHIAQHNSIEKCQYIVEEIKGLALVVGELLEQYVDGEVVTAARTSDSLYRMIRILLAFMVLLLCAALGYFLVSRRMIMNAISRPIQELEKFSAQLAGGDLQARAPDSPVEEMQGLTNSLNTMASRLQTLVDMNRQKQENLKKAELRTLQAQIAPHFLYNALDAIVWLAEARRSDEVIQITRALSDFFRISLSQGKDWIPLSQEIRHLTGYLTIQKVRYRDILDYRIDIPMEIQDGLVLKLLLQPLVENAIYHGIKHRRGKGLIVVTAREKEGRLLLSVWDNGMGLTPQRLEQVRAGLDHQVDSAGYGLYNVNQRIKLYYGQSQGVTIESDAGGTKVSLNVPIRRESNV